MRSLQKSSPNSCCRDGFHGLVTGLDDSDSSGLAKLVALASALVRFGGRSTRSNFSKGGDNIVGSGLGMVRQLDKRPDLIPS
jgi:hypothetical protein